MTTYEKIRYRNGGTGRARTIYLRNPVHRNWRFGDRELPVVTGIQVTLEGEDVLATGATFMILAEEEVVGEPQAMEMDLHYGWLVPEGTAKISVG